MADILPFPGTIKAAPLSTPPPDALAREQALDIRNSWLVAAPAGSGKTGLMIQRYLKLLADESVEDPSQVLAVTFTRKATFELRDRVMAQLQGAFEGAEATGFVAVTRPLALAVLARDRQRNWKLLEQPRTLNIRTIDSVCSEIAGSLPLLSRSGGALSPANDAGRLYAEAAARTTSLLGGSDTQLHEALRLVLLHRDGNLRECENLIASMLAFRDQWGELVPLASPELDDEFLDAVVLPKLERALELAICSALTRVTRALPSDFLADLCALASEMGHLEDYGNDPSPLAVCAGNASSPEEKAAHLGHWRALIHLLLTQEGSFRKPAGLKTNTLKMMVGPNHKKQLGGFIERVREDEALRMCLCAVRDLPPAHYPENQWPVAKALFRILARALVELQIVFSEHGECDFAEVGLLARSALRHQGALEALKLTNGHALQHLLVDEMQDTSSSQYELIELLTQNWDGHGQTVFLVGDPKQSIYLFRQARVERFVRSMQQEKLGDLHLSVLHLTANFRSQAKLVANFNEDFTLIFPSTADPLHPERVTYQSAAAVLPPTSSAARIWHAAVVPYTADNDRKREQCVSQRQIFASEIRQIAESWRAAQPGKKQPSMAVLVRSRSHLFEIVQAFKTSSGQAAVPYRAVEIESLAQRQEVLDLLALTRALAHPADRVAWLALLRSPLCGLTLADLHRLTGADDPNFSESTILDLLEARGDLLSEDGIKRLQPFWSVIRSVLAERGRLRLSQWIDKTFRAFNGFEFADTEAQTNISQFLNLLDELEEPGGTIQTAQLQTRLNTLYAAPSVHPGAVDLITIHGAKGLEWDIVFVPSLERIGQSSRGRLLTWLELDGDPDHADSSIAHGILAPIQSKGAESEALNRWMRSIESEREAAEHKRLFYVVCTRAREELHLFGAIQRSKEGELKPAATSLLGCAWPAAEDAFYAVIETTAAGSVLPAQGGILDQLAAKHAADSLPTKHKLDRIPLANLPSEPYVPDSHIVTTTYSRPEGSFAARSFGNTVHAFLEECAKRLRDGAPAASLVQELPRWRTRIANVIRANGLPASDVERSTSRVVGALHGTLTDPHGLWILQPHPMAVSEAALVSWHDQRVSLRMDRSFLAGAEPFTSDTTHLWIVDYKTSTHGSGELDTFLAHQRSLSGAQLEFYASHLKQEYKAVRLAIYYPLLSRLDWWIPQGD